MRSAKFDLRSQPAAMTLLLLAAVHADPALPSLPAQFDTWVTCNIVNKNYSVVVHEVHDGPNQRTLLSRWHAGDPEHGVVRTLYLFDRKEYYHVNSSGCYGDKLVNMRRGPFVHAHRTPTTHELFDFARENQTEVYMGTEVVHGVPCNHWQSVHPMRFGAGAMVLDHYFAVPEWSSPEGNTSEAPVLLHLSGWRPAFDGSGRNHTFDHYYAFNHFRVGPINDWSQHEFYVATPCVGNISSQPDWFALGKHGEYCDASCSDYFQPHGGVYFGFVMLGGVIALLLAMIGSFVCGRKSAKAFRPMMNETAVERGADVKPSIELPPTVAAARGGSGTTQRIV